MRKFLESGILHGLNASVMCWWTVVFHIAIRIRGRESINRRSKARGLKSYDIWKSWGILYCKGTVARRNSLYTDIIIGLPAVRSERSGRAFLKRPERSLNAFFSMAIVPSTTSWLIIQLILTVSILVSAEQSINSWWMAPFHLSPVQGR